MLIVGSLSVLLFVLVTIAALLVLNLIESFKPKASNKQAKQASETGAETEKNKSK